MAFTPFPDEDREDPSIVASNDKVTWVVPAGLTNPIVTQAQSIADGYGFNSDTELAFDGSTLVCFYRPAGGGVVGEAIYSIESTDGVTWTNRQALITNPAGGGLKLLSPAVALEADDTWSMWLVDNDNQRVLRRTSSDRATWSAASNCTIPPGVRPWHVTVVRIGSKYHMLCNSHQGERLFYWTSNDGDVWTGSSEPALPLTGDDDRQYRSAMTVNSIKDNGDIGWDVWVSGIDDDATAWLFSFLGDVVMWDGS